MTIHEVLTTILALLCGYFCGLGYGYRTANREYKAEINKACEAMAKGGALLERMRNRLRARRIIEMRQQLGKGAEHG